MTLTLPENDMNVLHLPDIQYSYCYPMQDEHSE